MTRILSSGLHRRILIMCVLLAGLVLFLDHASPLLVRLELLTLDWRFVRRGPRKPAPDVVLVTIDEKSLAELGQFSTWKRSWHGELVDILRERGAAAVAFDIFFSEPKEPREDAAF